MSLLNALPIRGAATNPTRFMNKNTPLSDMTLDQFVLIHGENPTKKVIPERKIGPPRSREEIRAEALYSGAAAAEKSFSPSEERESASRSFDEAYRESSPKRRSYPKGRLVRAVEPTPDAPPGKPMNEPCGDVVEMEFEIEGEGLVLLPLACEVLGHHPNQPHMARTPGHSIDPQRPEQDVFVGWADAL